MSNSETVIVQREFVLDTPQKRVWDLLGKVIYQCLPLEKVDVVNERLFYAELRWKIFLVSLKLHLKVEFVDILPPDIIACMISVKKGFIHLEPKVLFTLKPVNQQKTSLTCTATGDRTGILQWVMKKQQQRFAGNLFSLIGSRLGSLY